MDFLSFERSILLMTPEFILFGSALLWWTAMFPVIRTGNGGGGLGLP